MTTVQQSRNSRRSSSQRSGHGSVGVGCVAGSRSEPCHAQMRHRCGRTSSTSRSVTYGHLRSPTVTYGHLRLPSVTCRCLPPPTDGESPWAYISKFSMYDCVTLTTAIPELRGKFFACDRTYECNCRATRVPCNPQICGGCRRRTCPSPARVMPDAASRRWQTTAAPHHTSSTATLRRSTASRSRRR